MSNEEASRSLEALATGCEDLLQYLKKGDFARLRIVEIRRELLRLAKELHAK